MIQSLRTHLTRMVLVAMTVMSIYGVEQAELDKIYRNAQRLVEIASSKNRDCYTAVLATRAIQSSKLEEAIIPASGSFGDIGAQGLTGATGLNGIW